ncbi:MAG: ATP-binding protein [Armatimonadota bacterium]
MIVAVASGKGGTGKTTVATNLAYVAANAGHTVTYLDCDVEEPNGHLFLKPRIGRRTPVSVPVPIVDENKCTACGKCKDICQHGAIAVLGKTAVAFENLCHGCGGCILVCPEGAIREGRRQIGVIEEGRAGGVRFVHGKLSVGEAMSPPLIREVKKRLAGNGLEVIDAPPGTSCPVIQSIRGADFVLLVTEPTPFGLHDLKLAVETVRVIGLPFGVVLNRADGGDRRVHDYCRDERIDILLEIPDDRRIAEAYSRGTLAAEAVREYAAVFESVFSALRRLTGERVR